MIREEITPFLNKTVRLVKNDNFVLTGTIRKVNDDNILFETTQALSLIWINHIQSIVMPKEGNNG